MDMKNVNKLLQMHAEDVEFYAKSTTKYFFQRAIEIKKILDENERNTQNSKLESDCTFFKSELCKYIKLTRLNDGIVPKRRYSI